jgi:hypothetical protein
MAVPLSAGVTDADLAAGPAADDPWAVLARPGVRPEEADARARARLGPAARPDDPRRVRAIVGWLLERAARDGDTAMPAAVVASVLAGFEVPSPVDAIGVAVEDGTVLAFPAGEGGRTVLALDRYALAEESVAESLEGLLATAEPLDPPAAPASTETGYLLSAGAGVLLHTTGDPVRQLLRSAEEHGLRTATLGPGSRRPPPADTGLVVVTDAQLLDVEAAAELFDAVPDGARLVLAGDPSALPSPGPGDVLRDVAGCGAVPVVKASGEVRRGAIAELAAAVREGRLPPVHSPDREVVVVPAASGGEAGHRTVQLVTDSIPRALGIDGRDVQVVVPGRRGACGAVALNAALKARLNPGPGELGGFDRGDRVVAAGLAPGETGLVTGGTADRLVVRSGDREVAVSPAGGQVEHGWAITVRQSLGGRWPGVVVVLPGESAGLLSRPLVYTALTRAERHLSIVHAAGPALARAVAAVPRRPRRTRLAGLLREPE